MTEIKDWRNRTFRIGDKVCLVHKNKRGIISGFVSANIVYVNVDGMRVATFTDNIRMER